MPGEHKEEIKLEIAHVLFMDIVGYSKLVIDEQHASLGTLNEIVRNTEQVRTAEAAGKIIIIPTGDGMALVFQDRLEAPAECALEISRALKEHPTLPLRMGVHSGPVGGIIDVSGRANVAGAGINIAQRVMDCGDAGHILVSMHVAEDLEQYARWKPRLHDLGDCEVKHRLRVRVANLCTGEFGNSQLPERFKQRGKKKIGARISGALATRTSRWRWAAVSILALALIYIWPHVRFFIKPDEKVVAVLPFENLSHDPDNAFFAVGIQEEIVTRLAKIDGLKVIPRDATQRYAAPSRNLLDIAIELGGENILEGSVQRAGDQVHINVTLISAMTNEHLWAGSFDGKIETIFALESDVAIAVAEALKIKLTGIEQERLKQKPRIEHGEWRR